MNQNHPMDRFLLEPSLAVRLPELNPFLVFLGDGKFVWTCVALIEYSSSCTALGKKHSQFTICALACWSSSKWHRLCYRHPVTETCALNADTTDREFLL